MNSRTSRPRSPIRPDHHRVAGGVPRQHREQHRLADAGAGEDAEPLAAAAGGEDVHGPHAEVEPLAHPAARVGRRRRGAQGIGGEALRQRPLAVDRLAERVDDAAEPGHASAARPRPRAGCGSRAPGATPSSGPNGISRARVSRKPTTSACQRRRAAALDLGARADRQPRQAAARLDQQAVDRRHPAGDHQRIDALDGGDEIAQGKAAPEISAPMVARGALSIG